LIQPEQQTTDYPRKTLGVKDQSLRERPLFLFNIRTWVGYLC